MKVIDSYTEKKLSVCCCVSSWSVSVVLRQSELLTLN